MKVIQVASLVWSFAGALSPIHSPPSSSRHVFKHTISPAVTSRIINLATSSSVDGNDDDGGFELSSVESGKVLAYRASLFAVPLGIGVATGASLSGGSTEFISGATTVALVGSAAAIVLTNWASFSLPGLGWPVAGATFRSLGFVPLFAAGTSNDLHSAAAALALSTVLLCGREVFYFGLEFKVEAVAAVGASSAALSTQEDAAFVVWGLLLVVLASRKLFEPLSADLKPTQSASLSDSPLE